MRTAHPLRGRGHGDRKAGLRRLAFGLCCLGAAAVAGGGAAPPADAHHPLAALLRGAGISAEATVPAGGGGGAREAGDPRLWRVATATEDDERADLPPGAKVTREEASAIALKAVAGEVTAIDVERKLGRIVFTVEIMTPEGDETDVFVDVETGEVIGTD